MLKGVENHSSKANESKKSEKCLTVWNFFFLSMPVNKRVLKTKDKLLIINCIDSGVFKRFPLVLLACK